MLSNISFKLISLAANVSLDGVDSITLPLFDGEAVVLHNHERSMFLLAERGKLNVKLVDGSSRSFFVNGGVTADVANDLCTVIVTTFEEV